MRRTENFKKILSALLAFVLLFSLMPVHASAASEVVDAAVFFTDLHSSKSNAKSSITQGAMKGAAKSGLTFTSVTSIGDVFSSNSYNDFGDLDTITSNVRTGLGNSTIPVFYAWSDHDRNTVIDNYTGLVYGAGADGVYGNADDDNYYIYIISMADISTNDRYNTKQFSTAEELAAHLAAFTSDVAGLDHSKPMFIASHQPLLDKRNDNGNAYKWYEVISAAAEKMDIIFMFGHNHNYDDSRTYYYGKGDTMPVCNSSSGSATNVKLNFTHLCAGYLSPSTGGSSTRKGTVMVAKIMDDSIQMTTYNSKGVFTGSYAVDKNITRDHAKHEHTFDETKTVIVDPTCTEKGTITKTCTGCGEKVITETEALGHEYECVVTNATCDQNGSKVYTCTGCDDTYTEVIPATGHAYGSVVTAPSCAGQGYTTYTCGVCGDSYKADYTDALTHTYTSKETATCTQDGVVVYTCTTCGHTYEGETVKAYGHDYSETVVAPSCGKDGYTVYVCANCGDSYTGNIVTAPGHNYTKVVTAPSCDEGGYTTYTCTNCGDTYDSDYTAAAGHIYNSVVTPPTFEEEGYTTHTCTVCGDEYMDSFVPVKTHSYEVADHADATCEKDGYTIYVCAECGDEYTDIIAATGHNVNVTTIDATCEKAGAIVSTCTKCGDVDTVTIPALGHDYEETIIDATCDKEGYTTYTCACGDIVTETIPALGHDLETVTVAPTCANSGSEGSSCTRCDYSEVTVIPALGHSYNAVVVAPTCTTAGYTAYTCATCGNYYMGNNVEALGHSYVTEGYVHTCTACGHSYEDKPVEMKYTKVTKFANGNSYVITVYSGGKYYALTHTNNKISTVRVTVKNNKVTSTVTDNMLWDFSNNKLSYQSGGKTYYLYAPSSQNWWGSGSGNVSLSVSTNNSSAISFSSNRVKVGTYYLRYTGGTIKGSKTAATNYVYKETEA